MIMLILKQLPCQEQLQVGQQVHGVYFIIQRSYLSLQDFILLVVTVKFTVTPDDTGLHEEPDQLQISSGNHMGLRVEPTEYLTSKQVVAGSNPVSRSIH